MKKTLLIVMPLLLMVGCTKPINESTLIKRGEHMYEANATKPFSGSVFELHENGETALEGSYKDGFRHGDWTYFTKLGSGQYEVSYTAGSYNVAVFTDNKEKTYTGTPITEKPEKDGTYLLQEKSGEYDFSKYPMGFAIVTYGKQDGKWTSWYENGQKMEEKTFKDGERDGLFTGWYEDGQKNWEVTYTSGKKQGLGLYYTEDGQIKYEIMPPLTDIDGNSYKTIRIGDQVWMAENLKVTHYRNGDAIPNLTSGGDWANTSSDAYCAYDNNESYANTYGYLYNWFAVVDKRNIAPEGWHVPTDDEWRELSNYLGSDDGSKLAGNADLWYNGGLEDNSEFGISGFTALPGGYRGYTNGSYSNVGNYGYFWSSTEYYSNNAWHRRLYCNSSDVRRYNYGKRSGFSVRCVRD